MRDHLHRPPLPARLAAAALRRAAVAAATALVLSAAVTPALAASPAVRGAAGAGLTAASAAQRAGRAAARPVLLINGDQLLIRRSPRGGQAATLLPTPGAQGLVSLSSGGQAEEIPVDALPYLGRGLDPGLFSLTALRRAESGGRLPVRVAFAGRRPALPGVTITRTARGVADGFLTSSSAAAFGAALARQFRADHARGSYGSDGLFGGGVDIALGGPAGRAAPARPDFPMHTLTVTGSDLRGKPDTGDFVLVINADNLATFGDGNENFNFFVHGAARFSVPAGHYWAIGDFFSFTRTSFSDRLVVRPQFTVGGKGARIHLAERSASSQITTVTPRRAVSQLTGLTLVRGAQHGPPVTLSFFDFGGLEWVSPTTVRPTVGTLRSFTSAQLLSPPGAAGPPYAFNLAFQGPDGTIPAQHFVVTPASLATVNERYFQDVPLTGAWSTVGGFPGQLQGFIFALFNPLRLPAAQTQYMSAGQGTLWESSYFQSLDFGTGGQADNFRALPAGQQVNQDWNRYPLHPQPDVSLLDGPLGALFPTFPSAFRQGDTLVLNFTPFSDNEPGHIGFSGFFSGQGLAVTGRYVIQQNGVTIARGNPVNGIAAVRLSPAPSTVRFALTATRTGHDFPLSSSSTTAWTWRSVRRPGAVVPPNWFCGVEFTGNQFRFLRRCAVQPMLTLGYQVQGLGLDGNAPSGGQAVTLSVGHLQLAAAPAITGATARVSFDDGRIWQAAAVTPSGGGNFRISFTAPPGVDVSLRVSATDAAGASISETVLRAYGVGL